MKNILVALFALLAPLILVLLWPSLLPGLTIGISSSIALLACLKWREDVKDRKLKNRRELWSEYFSAFTEFLYAVAERKDEESLKTSKEIVQSSKGPIKKSILFCVSGVWRERQKVVCLQQKIYFLCEGKVKLDSFYKKLVKFEMEYLEADTPISLASPFMAEPWKTRTKQLRKELERLATKSLEQ